MAKSSGSQVVIQFGLKNLDRAKTLASSIKAAINDSLKSVGEVGVRASLKQAFKDAVKDTEDLRREPGELLSRRRRAPLDLNTTPSFATFEPAVSPIRRAVRFGNKINRFLSGEEDFTSTALDVLGDIPGPIGDLFDLFDKINKRIEKKVKEEVDGRVKAALASVQGDLDAIRAEFEAARDPAVLAEVLAERRRVEDKIHALGWHPEAAGITGY